MTLEESKEVIPMMEAMITQIEEQQNIMAEMLQEIQEKDEKLMCFQEKEERLQQLEKELSELLRILPDTEELLMLLEEKADQIQRLTDENQRWQELAQKQVKDTFESTYLVIGLLMSFIFLVYSSVLTAKLVIGEYNHRTITIMFSYPLNRIKLIASKLTIIMVYTAISMTIGYICCSSYIIFADKSFNMLEGTFQPSMLRTWIPMAITTVIICMVLSLWSFIIGMTRKSVPATIVTSLIVIVLRQVIITKNTTNQESIMQVILVAIVTVIATLLIFKRKVPELY